MAQPKNQSLQIERWDYRLTFAKKGRARYISHLDLMRAMQRAIKRAGVPIWYTQGFNPHSYLMFPPCRSVLRVKLKCSTSRLPRIGTASVW